MPGPEDYEYIREEGPQEVAHAVTEVTMADSNPAFYPAEAKSEPLRTDEEKQELADAEKTEASKGGEDVKSGTGETLVTKDEVEAAKSEPEKTAERRTVPKSSSK